METKFTSLGDTKESTKTVFTSVVGVNLIHPVKHTPSDYENALHIGFDNFYGDVFKCWNNDINKFTIYFGTAGDEFKK